ncbi:MAG: anaerobic ribonucleoside-triphosphate reductase activating protein [Patescibacteria group bacterium]
MPLVDDLHQPLRLAGLTRESVVDGPGLRAVVFVQGCPHRCPGCHNPGTWPMDGGYETTAAAVWEEIKDSKLLRGVTFSGGEPFAQAGPLAALAELIKVRGWDLMIYTGYTWEDLRARCGQDDAISRLLAAADILADGPYIEAQKDLSLPFRGSRNQRLLDLPRSEAAGAPVLWEPRWRHLTSYD